MHSRDPDLTEDFMAVAHQIRKRQVAALEPFGIGPSHSRALRVLERADGPMRLGDLAERLRIVPRSATDVVDALEASGHVQRRPDPHDRRAVLLELTPAGHDLIADIYVAQRHTSSDVFGALSTDDRALLTDLLERIRKNPVP